jgi:hypothetical protein
MTFVEVLGELKSLLSKPDVPSEVIDCALRLVKRSQESLFMKVDVGFAIGALEPGVSFQPSDRLLKFLAAARAGEWENIVISEMEHERTSQDLVKA